QWETERGMNRAPFAAREEALGAVFYDARGWERPQWYESNSDLVARYGVADRADEWDGRWWSPIINGEHLHMREKVGMVDLTAFQIFDVSGPGVLEYIERMTVNKCDVSVGRAVYTPVLAENGGFRSDLTILRLAPDRFRIVTGAFDGGRDEYWFRRNQPGDGSVQFENRTSALTTIGVWGPDAAAMMASVTDADLSQDAFPYGTTREVLIDGIPCRMFRISYVGENGWEVYTAMEHGLRLWDTLWNAGQPFDVRPVGIGVYGTTGRLEKGYRLMGAELESEYTPVEAGLARRKVKKADFIGKDAYLAAREADPVTVLCTLTVDDHTSASGVARYPAGGNEPILTLDGERIVDAKGRVSRVTSAGAGPSLGAYLLMAYLPPEHAVEGSSLQVMYMNETYPVTVARVGSKPLFDPDDERMKI
ncbi:MAG: aminomethyltransferase family protein, partial [Acidimicrobiia bacterium]